MTGLSLRCNRPANWRKGLKLTIPAEVTDAGELFDVVAIVNGLLGQSQAELLALALGLPVNGHCFLLIGRAGVEN